MPDKQFIQCRSSVNKAAVRRETIDGVEHIIVSSFTLPDNIVMNSVLYPSEEIEAGFKTLERTLAPVEHPQDADGNYISANDPVALHNYHAGAFNMNVVRENGRVHIEKHINVIEANKTDRGKRLLDRIAELETNENPRPIHTSVGVFLNVEQLKEPMVNAQGDKYNLIGRNMVFDHDAILLDNIAAATPEKGVGIAVNMAGDKFEVQHFDLVDTEIEVKIKPTDKRVNQEGESFRSVMEGVEAVLRGTFYAETLWIVDLYDEDVIFETEAGFFTVPYRTDDGAQRIVGIPIRVDRVVTYVPKVNQETGKNDMKDLILNLLTEAKVEGVDKMTESQLLEAYNELQANSKSVVTEAKKTESADAIALAVSSAVAPLVDQVAALQAQVNSKSDDEKGQLASVIVNSAKFPGLDVETALMLPVEKLKAMAANCGSAFGLDFSANGDEQLDLFAAPTTMPE